MRSVMPSLDPTNSNDREKIGLMFGKYFVDPGRRYRRDLKDLEEIVVESDADVAQLRTACDKQRQQIEGLTCDVAVLKAAAGDSKSDAQRNAANAVAAQKELSVWRRVFGGLTAVGLLMVCWWLSQAFGVGSTVWQKMIYSEGFLGGSVIAAVLSGCVVAGPRNLGMLSWPVNRFFGTDD